MSVSFCNLKMLQNIKQSPLLAFGNTVGVWNKPLASIYLYP